MRGFKNRTLGAIAVLVCGAVVSWGLAKEIPKQGAPPKKLIRQKDGHWSPYNAPAAAANETVHSLERGDTLWGLAGKYLENNYLWPQIWESNSYIKNPHWIYPGDPVVIKKQVVVTEERLKEERAKEPAAVTEEPSSPAALNEPVVTYQPRVFEVRRPGVRAISGRDLYCSGFITQKSPSLATLIIGAEDERHKANFAEGDIIYINKGRRQEIITGMEYAILRPRGMIKGGPKQKQAIGNYIAEIGKARVLVAHANTATAEVVFACDPVLIGDLLVPFAEKRSPLSKVAVEFDHAYALQRYSLSGRLENREKTEAAGPATNVNPRAYGRIVLAKDGFNVLGEGQIVYVDLGEQVGLTAGDILAVYRDPMGFGGGGLARIPNVNLGYGSESLGYTEAYQKAVRDRDVPEKVVGELVVLHVSDNTATAKIVYTREEVQVGDKVALLR